MTESPLQVNTGTAIRFQAMPPEGVKALVIALLLNTGNRAANEDRIVWAALTADQVMKCAGYSDD